MSSPTLSLKHRLADAIGNAVATVLQAALVVTTAVLPRNGRFHVRARVLNHLAEGFEEVAIEGVPLRLQKRALVTGRPLDGLEAETFQWIREMIRDGETIWDIGANIGLYSLWASFRHQTSRIFAFEPHAPTFAVLCNHVVANGCGARVVPLPLAIAEERFSLATFRWFDILPVWSGSQLDLPGAPPMWAGARGDSLHVLSASVDCLVAEFGLPPPAHLKIDVDGIEPLILKGARKTLREVRSVLLEFEKDRIVHHRDGEAALTHPLLEAGLVEERCFVSGGSGRNRLFVGR